MAIAYQVVELHPPSYVPSYVASEFLAFTVLGVVVREPAWPLSMSHVILGVWCGFLFFWMARNVRQQRLFCSWRLTITGVTYRNATRFAVEEEAIVEMPLAEITDVTLASGWIEVTGASNSDMFALPPSANLDALAAAFKAGNPAVRVTFFDAPRDL